MTGAPDADRPSSLAAAMAAIGQAMTAPPGPPPIDAHDDAHVDAGSNTGGDAGPPAPPLPRAAPAAALPDIDAEVRALLAPLLRDWLDAHLPEIVETAVHAELRRLTGDA